MESAKVEVSIPPPPVSTPPAATPAATASTNVLWLIGGRIKDYSTGLFKQRKPWTEVVDRSAFAKPANAQEAITRLRKNAAYFKVNYLIVIMLTLAITFISDPSSLLSVAVLLVGWFYVFVVRTSPITIGGRTFSEREKLMGMAAVSFIVVFFLTNVASLVFYALSVSLLIIGLHGATRVPDDLFLDEAETNTGLLSLFSAPVPTTGASAV